MANYIAYPKVRDTPNRKLRKNERSKVFALNKTANRKLKLSLRVQRQEQTVSEE